MPRSRDKYCHFLEYSEIAPASVNDGLYISIFGKTVTASDDITKEFEELQKSWIHTTHEFIKKSKLENGDNVSWATNHAERQPPTERQPSKILLLPLFTEALHTVAMIRHSIVIVRKTVKHLDPDHTPVITMDQPLFALGNKNPVGNERFL